MDLLYQRSKGRQGGFPVGFPSPKHETRKHRKTETHTETCVNRGDERRVRLYEPMGPIEPVGFLQVSLSHPKGVPHFEAGPVKPLEGVEREEPVEGPSPENGAVHIKWTSFGSVRRKEAKRES